MTAASVWTTPHDHELETLFELGRGGMGTAYLARALGAGGFERLLVIKRLGLEMRGMEGALERFLDEARVAARLHHVNIVGTHQIDRDSVGPFIVLDYIEGGSLDELIEAAELRGERLPVPVVLRIAEDALAGLHAVHGATGPDGRPLMILHRDLSIQNVLVGVHDGVARLSDFGVAKSALSVTRTNPGSVVGKVLYLPPEYLRGDPVGPTFDIYALGITLWMSLTGQEPWPDLDDMELARAIAFDGVPSLEGLVDVAPEVRALVERACDRDPRKRFQSAREMAIALERWERQCGWVATHAEVAACVERLLGDRLQARRDAVARLVSAPRATPRPAIHRLPRPNARTVELQFAPTALAPSANLDEALPSRRPRRRIPLALGAAVVILTPAAWAFLRFGSMGAAASSAPASIAVAVPAMPPSIPSPPMKPEPSATASLAKVSLPTPTTGSLTSVSLQPRNAPAPEEPSVTVLGEPSALAAGEPGATGPTGPAPTASPDPLGLKRLSPPGPVRWPRAPSNTAATGDGPLRSKNPYR